MKKLFSLFTIFLIISCSSDSSSSVRSITCKVNGVSKTFKNIKVYSYEDLNFEVPFFRLRIDAESTDGSESFSLATHRGGDYDGQSTNGSAFIAGKGYNYNFDHPLQLQLTINSDKRIKGTFEGIYTDAVSGEDIHFTEGTIDINYLPNNPLYIKQ